MASQGGGMIFGHQADSQDGASDDQRPSGAPMGGSFLVGAQPDDTTQSTTSSVPPVNNDDTHARIIQPPRSTADDLGLSDETELESEDSIMEPAVTTEEPQQREQHAANPRDESTSDETNDNGVANVPNADLLVLKQQALSDLEPLISQLDQTPEERFRTTMMMLQSTDNQALIKVAYAAAQEIEDEKARAQALLDVVNEINYFTQQPTKN